MLKTNKYGQALECIQLLLKQDSKTRDDGRIGLLRLRKEVGNYFGLMNEDIITNWLNFMMKFELVEEISTGQFRMIVKEEMKLNETL